MGCELSGDQPTATGVFPIVARLSFGPAPCTLVPSELTATVTGMSLTSNWWLVVMSLIYLSLENHPGSMVTGDFDVRRQSGTHFSARGS